jgi:hypothetical protein
MILSETTVALLKQLGAINNSVFLKQGTRQISETDDEKMLGIVELDEPLPIDFPVFSLSQFLANLAYIDAATIEFDESGSFATMAGGDIEQRFAAAHPRSIKVKDPKLVDAIEKLPATATFFINSENMKRILKLASNNLSEYVFINADKRSGVFVKAQNNHDGSFVSQLKIPKKDCNLEADVGFSKAVKTSQLAIVPADDYNMELIIRDKLALFRMKSTTKKFTYYLNFDSEARE